jgi:DNA-binding NtrC family response regulator
MSRAARILIIDDEPNVRLLFRTALEAAGYEVAEAPGGAEGLKALAKAPADLVLLDLRMPEPSGLAVLRQLRDAGDDVPVVIVTAHGSLPDAVTSMRLGAVDFLGKPVTPEALRTAAATALARAADRRPDVEPYRMIREFCG